MIFWMCDMEKNVPSSRFGFESEIFLPVLSFDRGTNRFPPNSSPVPFRSRRVCIAASHVRSRRVHRIYNTPSKPAHRSSWRLASRKVASGEQRGHEGKAVVVPPRDRRHPPVPHLADRGPSSRIRRRRSRCRGRRAEMVSAYFLCCGCVDQASVAVVEKWGRFVRLAEPGLHFFNIFAGEYIAGTLTTRVQSLDVRVETKTKVRRVPPHLCSRLCMAPVPLPDRALCSLD